MNESGVFLHSSMYGRTEPALINWQELPPQSVPAYNARRAVLCNSAVSAVDGFKIHTRLSFKYVYGMRLCLQCPNCIHGQAPDDFCQDGEGLSTEVEGGSLGRSLTIVGTSEFQKKRDEHLHYQNVVECLHTSSSLYTVEEELERQGEQLLQGYKQYVDHSCLQRYQHDDYSVEDRQRLGEETWPAHATDARLSSLPAYLGRRPAAALSCREAVAEGQLWKQCYYRDLNHIICLRQEHIHPINRRTGERCPLTACRRKDKPSECKHGFPQDLLIHDAPLLLCPGLAAERGLQCKGKRNCIGQLLPSRNSGTINATIPAMAIATGDNNDIKIPYRFPVTQTSHEKLCTASSCRPCLEESGGLDSMIRAVENSQAAQVGYHCDYCNKRQPIGVAEAKEWEKGHQRLSAETESESVSYMMRRHAKRICSDCYARGVLRTPNETTKLNDSVLAQDPTEAEVLQLASGSAFPGDAFLALVEDRAGKDPKHLEKSLVYARTGQKFGEN